jgi:hypothetical protein
MAAYKEIRDRFSVAEGRIKLLCRIRKSGGKGIDGAGRAVMLL